VGSRTCRYESVEGLLAWPNRDPLEEEGGVNLYRFGLNSPTLYVDAYGLEGTRGGDDEFWKLPPEKRKPFLDELRKKLRDPCLSQPDKSQLRRRLQELTRQLSQRAHGADTLRRLGRGFGKVGGLLWMYWNQLQIIITDPYFPDPGPGGGMAALPGNGDSERITEVADPPLLVNRGSP
jgi:hypothetical protein